MEVDYKAVDMDRHAKAIERVWPDGQHSQTYRAGWIAGINAVQDDMDVLRQALAAAEAECAEWRRDSGYVDSDGLWHVAANVPAYALADKANANDATRARLGLGRIGEAASS